MSTNDEIREFAKTVEAEPFPKDGTYYVAAARPMNETEAVTDFIDGLYHAMHVRDQIEEEMGYAGVTFHLEKVDEE